MATKMTPQEAKTKAAYNARPDVKKRRAANNAARREMMAKGLVHKGDGKDVAHIKPLEDGIDNSAGNLTVQSQTKNRGWRKGKSGYDV